MIKKIDDLGRVVIPKEIRNKLNLEAGDEVNLEYEDRKIIITENNDKIKDELERATALLNAAIDLNDEDTIKIYTGYVKALKFVLGVK